MEEILLLYDGSYNGLLSCIFECYERRLNIIAIQQEHEPVAQLFAKTFTVETDLVKAKRVFKGLYLKLDKGWKGIPFRCFLSEQKGIELKLLQFAQKVFDAPQSITSNFADPLILDLSKINKSIGREKHRMEAFVRFQELKDGLYFATIAPDFNVLPLITPHFKSRYADQNWVIYDERRKYGIHYDVKSGSVSEVQLELESQHRPAALSEKVLTEAEMHFQQLWQDYFISTGIAQRVNPKLHLQHVPKRYWRYLTEKV